MVGGRDLNSFPCPFKGTKDINILFKIQCCLRFLDIELSNFQYFCLQYQFSAKSQILWVICASANYLYELFATHYLTYSTLSLLFWLRNEEGTKDRSFCLNEISAYTCQDYTMGSAFSKTFWNNVFLWILMMMWIVKESIVTGFYLKTIYGQKFTKPPIVLSA